MFAVDEMPDVEAFGQLSGREAETVLWDLEQQRRRLEAVTLRLLGAVDRSGAFRDDGHATVGNWARGITNWTGAETAARCRAARMIHDLSPVGEAFDGGSLPIGHLHTLGRLYGNQRVRDQLPEHAETLVHYATTMPHRDFAVVAQRWESNADADGAHRRQDTADRLRDANVHAVGAEYVLRANLGSAQGAVVAEIFDAFCDAEFAADKERAEPDAPLARSAAQRRADALVAIFTTAANSTEAAGRGLQFVVNVTVDVDTFCEEAMRSAGGTPPAPEPGSLFTRHCHTPAGVPVDPADAYAMAIAGFVRRRVVTSQGVTIDLGRRSRLFTRAAKEALRLDDARCGWNGCGIPARWSQADHTTPWAAGGPTSPTNGGLQCPHHNRFKNHGYHVRRDPDGVWHTYRPDGSEVGRPTAPDPPG